MTAEKTGLITAGTGGVGGGFVDFLSDEGWTLFLPVRSIEKAQKYFGKPNIHLTQLNDFTDQEEVNAYIHSLQKEGVKLDLVALATGTWLWDDDKKVPGETLKEKYPHTLAQLKKANLDTKETFVDALISIYQEGLQQTDLLFINSQARKFALNDELRKKRPQEAYIFLMKFMDYWGEHLAKEGFFRNVFNEYTPLVDTTMTREQLEEEPVDWSKAHQPLAYAAHLFTKLGVV